MSDLAPIGDVLISAQAQDLTPEQLRARHQAIQDDYKRDPDAERAFLQMAWLCLLAIECARRHMGESSHEHDHRSADRPRHAHPGAGVRHVLGGGWRTAAGAPAPKKS